MIGQLDTATYTGGEIQCSLLSSLYLGYANTVYQYGMANTISFPLPNSQTLMVSQSDAQVDVIGYRNNILDTNFNLYSGEFCSYSKDWYMITGNKASDPNGGNGGLVIQPNPAPALPLPKNENMMMGQSTNKVLADIVDSLDKIFAYLQVIQADFVWHCHTTPGGLAPAPTTPPIVSITPPVPVPLTPPTFPLPTPDIDIYLTVDNDRDNIKRGTNLAGDNYDPNPPGLLTTKSED